MSKMFIKTGCMECANALCDECDSENPRRQNAKFDRWHTYFFEVCEANARMSYDPSTKVGAVIVRQDKTIAATGFNGFPRGCDDHPALYNDRDLKLSRVVHAEMNAILHSREPLHGYTLYVDPLPPCDRCMAHIIQSGIKRVVTRMHPQDVETRWFLVMQRAMTMAEEAGVEFVVVKKAVIGETA